MASLFSPVGARQPKRHGQVRHISPSYTISRDCTDQARGRSQLLSALGGPQRHYVKRSLDTENTDHHPKRKKIEIPVDGLGSEGEGNDAAGGTTGYDTSDICYGHSL